MDPLALWNEFKNVMCNDLHHRLIAMDHPNPTEEQIWDYGLYLLNEILLKSDKNLSHFPPMPMPQLSWAAIVDNLLLQQELAYDDAELHLEVKNNKDQFNAQQRTAFDMVMESVRDNQGKVFFLHSAGGCGKTFVCSTITAAVQAVR
ncbi:hypothetical protein A0H81_02876 [Grifola frondosa]|uniref:ATP-dependent DNA helicase n=1 Tax=Grifola frondosa TaxID=5627 RepID=A0A1C7MLN1_GRIFR|nr:hypothetical protein A0H81_02876 [Grifola frondosa]